MAKHFSELAAWQLAVQLRHAVHAMTDSGPARLDRDFYDDIRDAASSVPNNIAEGHARFNPTDNRRFLTFARASLSETQNRLMEGRERNFWSDEAFHEAWRLSTRAEAAIAGLMRYLLTERAKRNAEQIKRKIKEADLEKYPDEPTFDK